MPSRLFTLSLLPYMQPSAYITCLLADYSQMKLISKCLLCRVTPLFWDVLNFGWLGMRKISSCSGLGQQLNIHWPLLDHRSVTLRWRETWGSSWNHRNHYILGQKTSIKTSINLCAFKFSSAVHFYSLLPIFYP